MTDINMIRSVALAFLEQEIGNTDFEFIVTHPFTNSPIATINNKLLNLRDENDLKEWKDALAEQINRASITNIFYMMNHAYYLVFIKYIYEYLSDMDLGGILKIFWSMIEAPNMDINVTNKEVLKMFKKANKDILMNYSERMKYDNLPDEVTIYRGVTAHNKKNKKAVSWTLDKEQAQWFADRFDTGTGEVWELKIPKEKIICYFEYENEVIVDLYKK